jgi:response regulator of citrate/malate metabolism
MAFFCGRIRKKRTAQDGGAKNLQGRGIVIVQENGMIIESAGAEDELTYHNRSDDPDLLNKLKRAGVSVKTYKKLEALIRRMNWDAFTTTDLSAHLAMTNRNVRRIIASLCDYGLAECIGETSHATRGRPSKMYLLT